MSKRAEVNGLCIAWNGSGFPSIEGCTVERVDDLNFLRYYRSSNGEKLGSEQYMLGVDFFQSRLAALMRLRELLDDLGREHREALERVHLDIWGVDTKIEQEKKYGQ